jgi:hypothetical protein
MSMRLKTTHAAAEERLMLLLNEGYTCLYSMEADYRAKCSAGEFNSSLALPEYTKAFQAWFSQVYQGLQEIFPSQLEWNHFRTEEERYGSGQPRNPWNPEPPVVPT